MSEYEHNQGELEAEVEVGVEQPNYLLHLGLFVATCGTTYWAGGLAFAATLMAILVCHEMGHYIAARVHGVDASLPFFIPLPPGVSLGTLGAVIRMRRPIDDRNKLIDVGAAGPIAGLVVAIPLLILGLSLSHVSQSDQPGIMEGNSLAYIALKYLVKGMYLPAPDGTDVNLHPMAFAAWVGLLITMINLLPIGQLDGGHVARAYLGDRHERLSAQLHKALLGMAAAVAVWLTLDARHVGRDWGGAVLHGVMGALPWLIWSLTLLGMRALSGGMYHPPVGGAPLTQGRRRLAWGVAVIFVLIFTPVPMREKLGAKPPTTPKVSAPAQARR